MSKNFINVLDYDTPNDGSARATEGINAAIQEAKNRNGGTVYIPPGKYITGPIELISNLVLYIDSGAVLEFPVEELPFTEGRHQGIECITPVPLIGGKDLKNVTITGRGLLTTDHPGWMEIKGRSPGSAAGPNWAKLLKSLKEKTPATKEEYMKTAPELRPPFIRFMNSEDILVEKIHIDGSPMWPIHILYSYNASVRDVVVNTYPGKHTGGIYIDSSTYVRIENCFIETGDDGIVIKAGKDADGLRVNKPTENVVINNCIVRRAHGAVTLGSETAGGLRNISVNNIVCQGTEIGIRIKSRRGRGGIIEDVRFNNWTMENVGQAINVTNFYKMEGEDDLPEEPVSERTPVFKNIAISNITINHSRVPINVDGLPEMPIEGLRISNVVASSDIGLKADNTLALELNNIQINSEDEPAFLIRNSKQLELNDVWTRTPVKDTPVIRIDNSPGAVIRNSKAVDGTEVFLSTSPGELKDLVFIGNYTDKANIEKEELEKEFWLTKEPPTEGDYKELRAPSDEKYD
jgi:polygalacturonase